VVSFAPWYLLLPGKEILIAFEYGAMWGPIACQYAMELDSTARNILHMT
jgi:hypothetical protein